MAMMSDLTEAMLIEILIRLPVISLVVGKCVCKTWLSIISNPDFIKSQVHRSTMNPTLLTLFKPAGTAQQPQQLQLQEEDLHNSLIKFKSIVIPGVFDNISRSFFGFQIPSCLDLLLELECLSTCNGLICLYKSLGDEVIYVWNPSIRKCKKLPPSTTSFRTSKLGFGYDSISDDYKVVKIMGFYLVEVYSTTSDSWTQFQTSVLKTLDIADNLNVLVNGVLYLGNRDDLISFDLHTHVVGLVSFPPACSRENLRSNVMDFQGSLAMLFESGLEIFKLWTLEEGVPHQMSWTNKFSIRTHSQIWLYCYLGAGQFWGSGHYLFTTPSTRFLYDYESQEFKYYGPLEENASATLKYSETLVSLNGFKPVDSDDEDN